MNSTNKFLLTLFTLMLLSPLAKSACNSPSAIDPALAASESECIQRVSENCVWAADPGTQSGFSCQECQTVPPPSEGKTISQCHTDYPNDPVSFIRCAAINTPTLSLSDYCYNVGHGLWKEGGYSTEDRLAYDQDANDVSANALFYEIKLASQNSAEPLVVSEVAVISPNAPGGEDSVDLLIYNPKGVTVVDEQSFTTITQSTEIKLIENFNELGMGFSTINLTNTSSYETIKAATPNLAVNYSYTATDIAPDLLSQFAAGTLNTETQNYLFTQNDFLTRLEIRNKSQNYTTKDEPTIPRFHGLPEEIILQESSDYRTSLGLEKTANETEIKNKILTLKTQIRDLKNATSDTEVNSIKASFFANASGVILKIGLDSAGKFSKKNFKQLSIPKSEDMDVAGGSIKVPRSSTRSLNKDLSSYLDGLKNGNIRNEKEMISRNNIQNHLNKFSENNQMNSTLDTIIGGSCSVNSDCAPHEVCRRKTCICRKVECDGRSDGKVEDYKWIIDPDGKLVIDKKLIDQDQRDQIGSIFNDYVKDFIGEEGGSSTPQQQEESTSNNTNEGSESEQSTTPEQITQINPSCTDSGCGHNLNLGDVCNPTGPYGSGVIHQHNNKMLTVTSYPADTSETGYAECVRSSDREPEIHQVTFQCTQDGSIIWGDVSACANFAERTFSCLEFGNSDTVTQSNLTVFTRHNSNGSNVIANFQNDSTWYSDLSNQYKLLAAACNSTDWNSACINNPNSPDCYGEFTHQSVVFPDQLFPTKMGNLQNSLPGYNGTHSPTNTEVNWNYFEVNSRNMSEVMTIPSTIGVRKDKDLIFSNYLSITNSISLSQYNPEIINLAPAYNNFKMQNTTSDNYFEIYTYRQQAAVREYRAFQNSTVNDLLNTTHGNMKFYYDHLPLRFYGYGNLPNAQLSDYFESFCSGGCKNLMITSHDKCTELKDQHSTSNPTVDSETQYVCLPQNIDIDVIRHNASNGPLFHIRGYDDVQIKDLNIRVHGSSRINQAYAFYKNPNNNLNESFAKNVIDWMFPPLEYQWHSSSTKPENITELPLPSVSGRSWVELYPAFRIVKDTFDLDIAATIYNRWKYDRYLGNFDGQLYYTTNENGEQEYASCSMLPHECTVTRFTDLTLSQLLSLGSVLSPIIDTTSYPSGAERTREIATIIDFNTATPYQNILKEFFSTNYSTNTIDFIRPVTSVFLVDENINFLLADVSIKTLVEEAVINTVAKNNIIHGVNIEGYKLSELESSPINFNLAPAGGQGIGDIHIDSLDTITTNPNSPEYTFVKNNYYAMGMGITAVNHGDHLRIDKLNGETSFSDLPNIFPYEFNLCKSIDNSTPLSSTSVTCNPNSNYDLDMLFTANEFFNPFYFQNQGPEERTNIQNHWGNEDYFIKSHKSRSCDFYMAKSDSTPNTVSQLITPTSPYYKYDTTYNTTNPCTSDSQCSNLGTSDYFCGSNGFCSTDACDMNYIVISNSSIHNDTATKGVTFKNISGTKDDLGGNRELLQTNTLDAFIFNNKFQNNQTDMYDLNFRRTNSRTERMKNLVQIIDRNTFSWGALGKTTGEGLVEQIMKFSNNLFTSQRIGGYHALFKPFYLHNSHIGNTLLSDQQAANGTGDYLKPYGVRHSVYNSAVMMSPTYQSEILEVYSSRPRQPGFDYNFNYNLYFGRFTSGSSASRWLNFNEGRYLLRGNNLFDFAYPSNGCTNYMINQKLDGGCELSTSDYDPKFSFISTSAFDEAYANLGFSNASTITFFNWSNNASSYESGSLSDHKVIFNSNHFNSKDLYNNHAFNTQTSGWGKIIYEQDSNNNLSLPSYIYNGRSTPTALVGYTFDVNSIFKESGIETTDTIDKNRIDFLWENCYQNSSSSKNLNNSLENFKNDIGSDLDSTYRCLTGDPGSIFRILTNDQSYESFFSNALSTKTIKKDLIQNFVTENINTTFPTQEEIIKKMNPNVNGSNSNGCTILKTTFHNNKAPALHFDGTLFKSGVKLSVYKDFYGRYRKASTTRGAFELVGSETDCSSP